METLSLAQTLFYEQKNSLPLRIMESKRGKYLACPYEITKDNLELRFLNGDQRVAHFKVVSVDADFKRHFLYSKVGGIHLFTASGYMFTGPVKVYPWKGKFPKKMKVDMFHVTGDNRNETAGLDVAVSEHMRRLKGLSIESVSLDEVLQVYNLIRESIPRE